MQEFARLLFAPFLVRVQRLGTRENPTRVKDTNRRSKQRHGKCT